MYTFRRQITRMFRNQQTTKLAAAEALCTPAKLRKQCRPAGSDTSALAWLFEALNQWLF
jgi:hypothetical protein